VVNPVTFFPDPMLVIQKSLGSLAVQHQAIANNMANIDTPHFKRTVVSFQDKLHQALYPNPTSPLWRTHPMHFPQPSRITIDDFKPDVRVISDTIGRNDGNNVDMEMEQGLLAENSILYNSMTNVLNRYMAGLRHSISEGRQ
jgi:flagellar basal-body rod protein FlgB